MLAQRAAQAGGVQHASGMGARLKNVQRCGVQAAMTVQQRSFTAFNLSKAPRALQASVLPPLVRFPHSSRAGRGPDG